MTNNGYGGSCFCGAVEFTVSGEPAFAGYCHCASCRGWSAAPVNANAGQAVHAARGEWVRYSTPGTDGAEYIAICVPAFSPEAVRRDS